MVLYDWNGVTREPEVVRFFRLAADQGDVSISPLSIPVSIQFQGNPER
jgi:hypothetical protein